MKRHLALGIGGVLLALTGCGSSDPMVDLSGPDETGSVEIAPNPQSAEDIMLAYLRDSSNETDGTYFSGLSDKAITNAGHRVCKMFSDGDSDIEITTYLLADLNMNVTQAGQLAGATTTTYCPEYMPRFNNFGSN